MYSDSMDCSSGLPYITRMMYVDNTVIKEYDQLITPVYHLQQNSKDMPRNFKSPFHGIYGDCTFVGSVEIHKHQYLVVVYSLPNKSLALFINVVCSL